MSSYTRKASQPRSTVRVPVVGVVGDHDRVRFHPRVTEYAETPAHLVTPGGVRIVDPKAR